MKNPEITDWSVYGEVERPDGSRRWAMVHIAARTVEQARHFGAREFVWLGLRPIGALAVGEGKLVLP